MENARKATGVRRLRLGRRPARATRWLVYPLLVSVAIGLCLVARTGGMVFAASLPSGFAETQIASGIPAATAMAFAPDGRLFVAEQAGKLRVIKNGVLLSQEFVSITVNSTGERGLLGVAFHPNFATNRYVYVYYTTASAPIHNRVSRFTASTSNPDVAAANSEEVILDLENLSATNHNGGAMHFGADGKLYIAVGENAVTANSQTLNNRLGKMLRINDDGSIPSDNPFYNQASGVNRSIWTLGLRNPFTFALQPGTGRMFINDVGGGAWEEINDGIAGANYGWPNCEGNCNPPNASYRDPVYQYANANAPECAITGGAFYNPPTAQYPSDYVGDYFFADFCGGWIKRYDPASGVVTNFASGISAPVDLKVASDGSLYYLSRGTGTVWRIRYTANQAPTIGQHPTDQTAPDGGTATFTVSASGTAPLSYQWQRNNVDIPNTNSASYTVGPVGAGDNGVQFRVIVTNDFGSATSNPATLTVTPNQRPTAAITSPGQGALYTAGQSVSYEGTGNDPEEGSLPASAFTWQIDFHHDQHSHPFMPAASGAKSGTFTPDTEGETAANVWYRITLTVTDARGLSHTVFRDIHPRTAQITLETTPSGLQVTLDGQPQTSPHTVTGVVGVQRSIGAPSPQTKSNVNYEFQSWSDSGAGTHTITTPSTNTTYTAQFRTITFFDVPSAYWARSQIDTIYTRGITTGCATNPLRYCPDAVTLRDQMAVFLLRALKGGTYSPPPATGTVFVDVPASYWAAAWIEQLFAEGLTDGCGTHPQGGRLYCPTQRVTRAEMAVFLLRAKHGSSYQPPAATQAEFKDVPLGYWAVDWVNQAFAEGITQGCVPGNNAASRRYCPDADVTRAQMAVFLVRTFNLTAP
jgi:glucose/arabinose dehydrogenase